MLTKEHIKYSVRKDRVIPFAIKEKDTLLLDIAENVREIMIEGKGKTESQLRQAVSELASGKDALIASGLLKLCQEKSVFEELSNRSKEERWSAITRAEDLRSEFLDLDFADYQERIRDELDISTRSIAEGIYKDLPQFRKLEESFSFDSTEKLIQRFNTAQVQSLLMKCKAVTLEVPKTSPDLLRLLLRQIKFHRLECQIESGAKITLTISGPMGQLQQKQMYGDLLANFFPHVLQLPNFKFETELEVKKRNCRLKITHKSGLVSHYKEQTAYIPLEFQSFVDALPKKKAGLRVDTDTELMHLGDGVISIPDFFVKSDKSSIAVELFHKWHAHTLSRTLDFCDAHPLKVKDFRMGVSRTLAKSKKFKDLLDNSQWFQANGFVFTDFPTVLQVLKVLP